MKSRKVMFAVSVLIVLAMLYIPLPAPRVAQADCGANCWDIIPSPNASTSDNVLQAVAAISTDDVWAVG